jgi:hypothetical protein
LKRYERVLTPHVVRAREQAAERESATFIGDGGPRGGRADVNERDRGGREYGSAGILDAASQRGGGATHLCGGIADRDSSRSTRHADNLREERGISPCRRLVRGDSDHLKFSINIRSQLSLMRLT